MYEDSIVNLKTRKPVEKRTTRNFAEKEQAAKDYYASVRTNVSRSGRDALNSVNEIKNSDIARLGLVERKPDLFPGHDLPTLIDFQLILIVTILTSDRVPETFTSSDLTVAKGYLVFVLVFVALTSIIVSVRPQTLSFNLTNPGIQKFSLSTLYLVTRMFTG